MKIFFAVVFSCFFTVSAMGQIANPTRSIDPAVFRSELQQELSKYPHGAELYRRSDAFERIIDQRIERKLGLENNSTSESTLEVLEDTSKIWDVSHTAKDENETSIAINRKNSKLIVAGANDEAMYNLSMPAYLSTDAGINWKTYRLPTVVDGDATAAGDPMLVSDDAGNFYYAFLIIGSVSGLSDLMVAHSANGKTWTLGNPVLGNTVSDTSSLSTLEDKPTIAVDRGVESPYHGRVYIAWTHFDFSDWTVTYLISHSDNQGLTWSSPTEFASNYGYFALLRIGSKGTLYFASSSSSDTSGTNFHGMIVSHDGGSTFEEYPIASYNDYPTNTNGVNGLKGYNGFRAFPYVAFDVDPSSNKLFAVYGTFDDNGDAAQYATTSTNDGKAWSEPKQIGSRVMLGNDHFFPWVSFDPVDQQTYITLYSSEEDTIENVNSRAVRCNFETPNQLEPLGSLFDPTSLTVNGYDFLGDYIGSDAWNGAYAAAWTEPRLNASDGDVFACVGPSNAPIILPRASVQQINATQFDVSEPSPNPAIGNITTIRITSNEQNVMTARLYDQRGAIVLSTSTEINPDQPTNLEFDLSHLSAGIYRAVFSDGRNSAEKNIVVIH
ncbi:MAG TPA: T9SS type A sorting domain-containing protein [Candidatus Kapabacteria bacterium]|jgi:hypothetical protein|nr:T9SS type A sorting domain-containing protein [Candidatus Kapabacteria bacterium]